MEKKPRALALSSTVVEVALDRAQVVNLLSQNVYTLREDLALMESGFVKCQSFGANVTHEQAARLEANLSRLHEVINAFENNMFGAPPGEALR